MAIIMIIYFWQNRESSQNVKYKQTLVLGGKNMINKNVNFTITNELNFNESFFKEDEQLKAFSYVLKLDNLLNLKIDEYGNYTKNFKEFQSKFDWLINWKKSKKSVIIVNVLLAISGNLVSNQKLSILQEIILGYFEYFEILSQEPDSSEGFEETFNTILQIPAEIYQFINVNEILYEAEFTCDLFYENGVKKNSKEKNKDNFLEYLCA